MRSCKQQPKCSIKCIRLSVWLYCLMQFVMALNAAKKCSKYDTKKLHFQLIRQCKRSKGKFITLENTQTLEECMELARQKRGLALNYSPQARRNNIKRKITKNASEAIDNIPRRRYVHFLEEPEKYFNCHVLECPENSTLYSMVNDNHFDYFSLYAPPKVSLNYSCLPGIGIAQIQLEQLSYLNASLACRNSSIFKGALAHVASFDRTNRISTELRTYNIRHRGNNQSYLSLVYVGLHFNRSYMPELDFHNAENESLNCFHYRGWAPGHPTRPNYTVSNTSCVAITLENSWKTVDCKRKLPFVCDIYTMDGPLDDFEIGATHPDQCIENIN